MPRRLHAVLIAAAHCLTGATVFAHPGHGVIPPDEPAHWLEPVHLLPVLGTAAVTCIAYRWLSNGGQNRPPR